MSRVARFEHATRAVGAVAGLAAGDLPWPQLLDTPIEIPVRIALVIVGVIVIPPLLARATAYEPLRRLVFGPEAIEGRWVDVLVQDGRASTIGITRFAYRSGSVVFEGENFSLDGQFLGRFRSHPGDLTWPVFSFIVETTDVSHEFRREYAVIWFDDDATPPTRYSGLCIDLTSPGTREVLHGLRPKTPPRALDSANPSARFEAARALIDDADVPGT